MILYEVLFKEASEMLEVKLMVSKSNYCFQMGFFTYLFLSQEASEKLEVKLLGLQIY